VSDEPPEPVVEFIGNAESALSEYEKGYADADATVGLLERYLDELRRTYDME
jgi:hypothetical protein